jgi:hypothetical protein
MALIPRVRDHVAGLIQRIAEGQAAGRTLELNQAIRSTVYLTKEIIEMCKLHESYLGREAVIQQCVEAVADLCAHGLKAVSLPYVPVLVAPILNKFVAYILEAVASNVAEILYDRMLIQPPAPAPTPVPGTGHPPTGSVPVGNPGAGG